MINVHTGFPATRRLVLRGVGAIALTGLGIVSFGAIPVFAAANDK